MFPTPPAIVPSLQARVHPDEWQVRLQLAACYRVFAMLGWTEMIYNHITLRLPDSVTGGEKHFLINPFGLHYSEVTASNLLKIDVKGHKLEDSPWDANPAGFTVHSAIHEHVPQAHCVMHTHTTAGLAVACTRSGLAQNNFYSAQLGDMVAYHDFEGITVHADEAPRLLQAMGNRPLLILRNHGLLAWGRTLPTAFYTLWILQRACEVQCAGAALGPRLEIPQEVQRRCARDARHVATGDDIGRDAFEAMVRLVDRIDPSWRD